MVEHLEWNIACAGVRVTVLEGSVRDELRNILFKLTKVLRDVSLRKMSVLIVCLLLGDTRVEIGFFEVKYQVLAQ